LLVDCSAPDAFAAELATCLARASAGDAFAPNKRDLTSADNKLSYLIGAHSLRRQAACALFKELLDLEFNGNC
jgi:hypothetical protein